MTHQVDFQSSISHITSGYNFGDGIKPKVPYSFFGSIFDKDEEEQLLSVLRQDALTNGPQVTVFQKEFAQLLGVKHAFAVSNCTTAMHVATQAFGIGPGDEVIVTPNTFIATTLVILKEGGIPVYADIDPRTYNIDPVEIAKKITPKTKAIYVVHYAGQMCDMDPIMALARRHNLFVLEDCAHAIGSVYKSRPAGSIGDVGCFSFHSLKNITTGEGGMITTNRDDLVEKINLLRNMNITHWGEDVSGSFTQPNYWLPSHFDVKDVNGKWGINYRMTEFQAALGRAQLRKIDLLVEKRRDNARYLSAGLEDIPGYIVPYEDPNCIPSYHLYTLCVDPQVYDRDEIMRDIYYRQQCTQGILHYQPTYDLTGVKNYLEARGYGGQFCPVADKFFYQQEFDLPMNPRLTREQLDIMIAGLRLAAERCRR
jgi:dTDP-4-amino-4,6-dideoxygalactose transaminase